MESLIDILPGIPMPIENVNATLRKMWDAELIDEDHSQSDFRASQMNLILHFGLNTSKEEAQSKFDQAIGFAQRYPCRIIVLCPSEESDEEMVLEGKLFSQCFIGNNIRDLCCCEALILGYSIEQSNFLENQVSLWLESDLPTYHWFHRVPVDRINAYYLNFLKHCRRILIDTTVDENLEEKVSWPDASRVRDLAYARSLPFRQHIGQFLSSYSELELVEGLESIHFCYEASFKAEIKHLMAWHESAVMRCLENAKVENKNEFKCCDDCGTDASIQISWVYHSSNKYLKWDYNVAERTGRVETNLKNQRLNHSFHIEPIDSIKELAESLFF